MGRHFIGKKRKERKWHRKGKEGKDIGTHMTGYDIRKERTY